MLHLNQPCQKISNTFIDNAEDLDIVVPMYSLLKYSDNYFLYLGFLSRTFKNHRTAGEGGGYFFNSSPPLTPASQTLRH